jgi:hypothetical protein
MSARCSGLPTALADPATIRSNIPVRSQSVRFADDRVGQLRVTFRAKVLNDSRLRDAYPESSVNKNNYGGTTQSVI